MNAVDKDISVWTLEEALRLITTDRREQHGPAEECFQLIADIINIVFGAKLKNNEKFTKVDVSLFFLSAKIARHIKGSMSVENFVDICGYAALATKFLGEET
jgi:hypothetical protein